MSDNTVKGGELNDIDLCYTALGLSLGDSPAKIEMAYHRLSETYKANLSAPDPRLREDAKESLKLIEEMYGKIKNSVTYQAMLKDQERRSRLQGDTEKVRNQSAGAGVMASSMMNCPTCTTVIRKGLKTCPRCKAPILTPIEQVFNKIFTKTNVIVFSCIVLICMVVFIGLMFPEQIKGLVNLFRK